MKHVKIKVLNSINSLSKESGLSKKDINHFIKMHNIQIFNLDSIHFSDVIIMLKHYNISYVLDDVCLLKDRLYSNTLSNTFYNDRVTLGVIGHINHGKTHFISGICSKNIQEDYLITQKVHVYSYKYFDIFDTPGHEVFDLMRERIIHVIDVFAFVISLKQSIEYETKKIIDMLNKYNLWHRVMFIFTKGDIAVYSVDNIINELKKLSVCVEKDKYVVTSKTNDENVYTKINEIVHSINTLYKNDDIDYDLICFNIEYINQQEYYLVKVFKSFLDNKTFLIIDHYIARIIKIYDLNYKPITKALSKGIYYITLDRKIKTGKYFITQDLKIVEDQQKLIKYNLAMLQKTNIQQYGSDDSKNIFFVKDDMTIEVLNRILKQNNIIHQCRVLNYINASIIASFNKNDKIIFFNFDYNLDNKCGINKENVYYIDNIYKIIEFIQNQRNEVINNNNVDSVAEIIKVFKIRNMYIAGCKIIRGYFEMGDSVYIRNAESEEDILSSDSDTIVSIKKNTSFIKKCKKNDIVGFILLKCQSFEDKTYIYKVIKDKKTKKTYRRK